MSRRSQRRRKAEEKAWKLLGGRVSGASGSAGSGAQPGEGGLADTLLPPNTAASPVKEKQPEEL